MCGIAGVITVAGAWGAEAHVQVVRRMTDVQSHRGPDAAGLWTGRVARSDVGFGHRRLAIIDLSPNGNQPFASADGQYLLTFNGELYNYLELRQELQALGRVFRTDCDTEVLLQAYMQWGEGAFARFNGMWALALLDRPRGCIVLARDRFGEKPLYTHVAEDAVYFASEIKAICVGAAKRFRVHLPAAGRFLSQAVLDAQRETFFEGILQVPAGHVAIIDLGGRTPTLSSPRPFWTLRIAPLQLPDAEAVQRARELFESAVKLRLRSDVPVGVLLSGGLDSSSIAAMVRQSQPAGRAMFITAVSDVLEFNEEPFAEAVSKHLNSDLHKVRLNPDPHEAFAGISDAVWWNDEPIGGFSAVAHRLLMKRAQELGVTVLLSGQGADEGLAGYLKYVPFLWRELLNTRQYGALSLEMARQMLPPWPFLASFRVGEAKRYLRPLFGASQASVLGPAFADTSWSADLGFGARGFAARQVLDFSQFSVPSLVHYEDRMSMASSREVRLPFLDHRLVELFVNLEPRQKVRRGWRKWVLRQAMSDALPRSIAWRRLKQGFSNPSSAWLRTEWRAHVKEVFAPGMLIERWGLVDQPRLADRYRRYCDHPWAGWETSDIFNPLSLELWARKFQDHIAG